MHKSLGASRSDWETPGWILDGVRRVFGGRIELDPATTEHNPTDAERFYTPADDGLKMPWNAQAIFLNPPWSRVDGAKMKEWLKRAKQVRDMGSATLQMCVLVSASVNSHWFHDYLGDAKSVFFPRGRVRYLTQGEFGIVEGASPGFDSVLLYFGPRTREFRETFRSLGLVLC